MPWRLTSSPGRCCCSGVGGPAAARRPRPGARPRAESQWHAEPKRRAKLGYLSATFEPGVTPERTRCPLTDRGVEALRRRMEEPAIRA